MNPKIRLRCRSHSRTVPSPMRRPSTHQQRQAELEWQAVMASQSDEVIYRSIVYHFGSACLSLRPDNTLMAHTLSAVVIPLLYIVLRSPVLILSPFISFPSVITIVPFVTFVWICLSRVVLYN